ncbi:MAG: hypothetical protein GY757_41765 [bacterium]|nr:hypothetical protein [bacterium]
MRPIFTISTRSTIPTKSIKSTGSVKRVPKVQLLYYNDTHALKPFIITTSAGFLLKGGICIVMKRYIDKKGSYSRLKKGLKEMETGAL